MLNAFEKVLLALAQTAPVATPIAVHSPQGLLIVNASEVFVTNLMSLFVKPATTPAPPPAPPAA